MTPCTGFTPGQKLSYHLRSQISQSNCKIVVQLNCLITCRSRKHRNNPRQIKQIVNRRKHLPGDASGYLNIPLDSHISREDSDEDTCLKYQYLLEAVLVDANKHVLLTVSQPLTIGTTPCFTSHEEVRDTLCYDNYGESICLQWFQCRLFYNFFYRFPAFWNYCKLVEFDWTKHGRYS